MGFLRLTLPLAALAVGAAGCGDTSAPSPSTATSGEHRGTDPASPEATAPDARGIRIDAPRSVSTRGGEYSVAWQPVGGFIPVNEPFEVEVEVTDPEGAPVPGARVAMDCRMPDHGHGMLRVPRSEEQGDGRYLVRGLLLHMGGHWTVTLTVVGEGGVAATADDEVTL